jgi:hypothetical protein
MKILLVVLVIWAIFHFVCCCNAAITVKPDHRAAFVQIAGRTHPTLIVIGGLTIAAIPILLVWGYGAMSPDGEPLPHPSVYRALLPIIWLIIGIAVLGNTSKEFNIAPPPQGGRTFVPLIWWSRWTRHPWIQQWWPLRWRPFLIYAFGTMAFFFMIAGLLEKDLNGANRFPTYWRSINLISGVSPLVPLLALCAGIYGWFWYSLQGLALFGPDRPQLPKNQDLLINLDNQPLSLLRMFSDEDGAQAIEADSKPFSTKARVLFGLIFICMSVIILILSDNLSFRSLGSRNYSLFYGAGLVLLVSTMLANAWQSLQIWIPLRQLLIFLSRLPLRRTMADLNGITWGSVWEIGGNVFDSRYKLLTDQLEAVTHFSNDAPAMVKTAPLESARLKFAEWYASNYDNPKERDLSAVQELQQQLAAFAAEIIRDVLVPYWRKEGSRTQRVVSKGSDLPPEIRYGEEFVCLLYLGFIQNVLGRFRTLVMGVLFLFVAAALSIAVYPFDPRPILSGAMLLLFLILGTTFGVVYAQMYRDTTLSLVTKTVPGELGIDFWFKLIGFCVGPVVGLLATIFPGLPDFVFSMLQLGGGGVK